jgi:hypothetical protein
MNNALDIAESDRIVFIYDLDMRAPFELFTPLKNTWPFHSISPTSLGENCAIITWILSYFHIEFIMVLCSKILSFIFATRRRNTHVLSALQLPYRSRLCVKIVTGANWNMHRYAFTTVRSHGSFKSRNKIIPRTSQPHHMCLSGISFICKPACNGYKLVAPFWRSDKQTIDSRCSPIQMNEWTSMK